MKIQENNQEFMIMLQEDQRMQENFKDCKNNLQQPSSSFFSFLLNANARI